MAVVLLPLAAQPVAEGLKTTSSFLLNHYIDISKEVFMGRLQRFPNWDFLLFIPLVCSFSIPIILFFGFIHKLIIIIAWRLPVLAAQLELDNDLRELFMRFGQLLLAGATSWIMMPALAIVANRTGLGPLGSAAIYTVWYALLIPAIIAPWRWTNVGTQAVRSPTQRLDPLTATLTFASAQSCALAVIYLVRFFI
jgi:hypothetical protein